MRRRVGGCDCSPWFRSVQTEGGLCAEHRRLMMDKLGRAAVKKQLESTVKGTCGYLTAALDEQLDGSGPVGQQAVGL